MSWYPWLEAAGVSGLAVCGALLGLKFSRLPKPYWTLGYFIPLAAMFTYGVAWHLPALALVPPVSWMMAGRTKFAVIGFIITMVFTTPLSRVRLRSVKILVSVLMVLATAELSVWPFLAPALNRKYLSNLHTRIDSNGVCRQNTDYTCGPAAAVTALRRLGLSAEEGEIAIRAHTTSVIGTPPDILASALQQQYGSQGLSSEFRVFGDVEELSHSGFTLAVIKYRAWVNHYVTVLEVMFF